MKHITQFTCGGLIWLGALAADLSAGEAYPLRLGDIHIRDPFIYTHPETKTYYLYAQAGRANQAVAGPGVQVYQSKDLRHWSKPALVFQKPANFWGGHEIWAPEMHRLGGAFYLFVSFNGRAGGRGTQILRAGSPEGPFEIFSAEANTPPEERCLDGTPWVDPDGTPWLIYCHEWVQIGDGAMKAVRMQPDWSARVGTPLKLFHASEASWARPLATQSKENTNYVTDGPFLHRTPKGKLLMLWSSFGEKGYAMSWAQSDNGRVDGKWAQQVQPLFATDGGHCMVFRTFEGQLTLVLHQPNSGGKERARLFHLVETADRLSLASAPE